MKECTHRFDIGLDDRFGCSNHADLLHDGTVSRCVCDRCPYAQAMAKGFEAQTRQLFVTMQRRGEYRPKAKSCGGCGEPKIGQAATRQSVPGNLSWAVTITTAPRTVNYLPEVLASLSAAGWSDPIVFAEPGAVVPYGVRAVKHERRMGCFRNWLQSAQWALDNTDADQILMMQDDTVVHPDSRILAEQFLLWPDDAAFVSLYTPSHYSKDRRGLLRIHTKNLWGTCAVIWRRDILRQIVDSEFIRTWHGMEPKRRKDEPRHEHRRRVIAFHADRELHPEKINQSDYAAGKAVLRLAKRMYYVSPSPAVHIAEVSSIRHGDNSGRRNCGLCADYSEPLEPQVFGTLAHLES